MKFTLLLVGNCINYKFMHLSAYQQWKIADDHARISTFIVKIQFKPSILNSRGNWKIVSNSQSLEQAIVNEWRSNTREMVWSWKQWGSWNNQVEISWVQMHFKRWHQNLNSNINSHLAHHGRSETWDMVCSYSSDNYKREINVYKKLITLPVPKSDA